MGLMIDDRAGNSWVYAGGYFKDAVKDGDPSYEYGHVVVGLGGSSTMVVSLGRELFVRPVDDAMDRRSAAVEVITRDGGFGRMLWTQAGFYWVTGVEFVSEHDGPDGCTIHQFRALLKPTS